MPLIDRMIAEWGLASGEHGRAAQSVRKLFRQFHRELDGHLKKEEDILFPALRRNSMKCKQG